MAVETIRLKITAVNGSLGIILPGEVLERLNVKKGSSLFLVESADGFLLTSLDPEFEEDMALARKFMRKRRNLLRDLAK
jgi:putative addiction module antidote